MCIEMSSVSTGISFGCKTHSNNRWHDTLLQHVDRTSGNKILYIHIARIIDSLPGYIQRQNCFLDMYKLFNKYNIVTLKIVSSHRHI